MHDQIATIAREAGARDVAASLYDYETETAWSYRGDRWFHAASTMKIAVLAAVFAAVDEGRLALESPIHVRNRFLSVVDGEPYRIASDNDANAEVYGAVGRTMRLRDLARHMIVTSSNLATNVLLDVVGLEYAQRAVSRVVSRGVELRRGVEDHKAFEAEINNLVTANGLVDLLCAIEEGRAGSAESSRRMLEILHGQEFNSGIPAGLPDPKTNGIAVAHKTGEISTIAHDAGLVYVPRRRPYAVAILTSWEPETGGRQETIARISRAIFEWVAGSDGRWTR